MPFTDIKSALQQGLQPTLACHHEIETKNPEINAFITHLPNELGQEKGPLAHIPIAIKDLIEINGVRTTCGTPFFKYHISKQNAAVVEKLREAGAALIGKTNTHEIALGLTGINPHFGAVRNPHNHAHITGGSSSGSAAAVAAGMCVAALGTDTGGSIRVPAALCGVVGLKPTYGRVSLRGIFPLSWNLDHCGPLTLTVQDAALLLNVLAGYDALDPASADLPVEDYSAGLEQGISGWKIARLTGKQLTGCAPEILASLDQAVRTLQSLGASVHPVTFEWWEEAGRANGCMVMADAAAFHRNRLAEHAEWFGEDVRKRLEIGRDTTSTTYSLARQTQAETKRQMTRFFENYDALILPTTPITAPALAGVDSLEQAMRLTRYTNIFNLTGLPALSLPVGKDQHGLPIGLQIVGPAWAEARVLRMARSLEKAIAQRQAN